MAKKLKTLFAHRQKMFEKNTESIFTSLYDATVGIIAYLRLKEEISQGEMTWTNIIYAEPEGLVTMIGLIQYPPGSSFQTTDGEKITVSADTVEYFSRIMRFTLPYELCDKGTAEEVVEFMQALEHQENIPEDELLESDIAEFEFDDLTEEQKAAIMVDYHDKAVH